MNIHHSSSRGNIAAATADVVALSTSRHKSILLFLTIAIYASLSLFLDQPPQQKNNGRLLAGEITQVESGEAKRRANGLYPIKPYTLEDALKTQSIYKSQFGLAVYSPLRGDFTLYYPSKSKWKAGCHKLVRAFEALSTTLLDMNITQEIVLPISAGDSPRIQMTDCVVGDKYPCFDHDSPILQFGSGFNHPVIPGELLLPVPLNEHLFCFQEYSHSGKLCPQHDRRTYYDIPWEELIPQVVWRGTDFTYLGHFRNLRAPEFEKDLGSLIETDGSSAVRAMKAVYEDLVPRWKGVVLTAEAESEVKDSLPWVNIKFSHFMFGGKKTSTSQESPYLAFQSSGIPCIGDYMSLDKLAQFKYHIDLGGGGGTTWSGTLDKLALPGMLFHHSTPTKDYFHDAIKPWVHYVPVKEDLSDLKEKFEWAEANQDEARKVAERSTEWVKQWFGREGFQATFNKFYKEPLRAALDAYQRNGDGWEQVLENAGMEPIMRCSGVYGAECEQLDGSLHYYANRG